jgi:hypothetical protein
VQIRCTLDGLLLDAHICPRQAVLTAYDGDEGFVMEAVEAVFYELVSATVEEVLLLEQARYRLLRPAPDFQTVPHRVTSCPCGAFV